MKKLNFVFILFFLLVMQESFCQNECDGCRMIQVYPKRKTISSNSAFLIDFCEKYHKIKNEIDGKLDDYEFEAISTTGGKYKLTMLETNFSGGMGQFFLKSKSGMNIGDTISISISLKNKSKLEGNIKVLFEELKWYKWIVKYKKDKEKPQWRSGEITYQLFNYNFGLAVELDPYGVMFLDNSINEAIEAKDYESSAHYFLIDFMNGRFISSGDHTTPRLFNWVCNGNFNFENNKSYSAKLRAIDASGNFSKKIKVINFDTTISNEKPINTAGPYTSIPDVNFERALIQNGYDTGEIDGKVPTANIANITNLQVNHRGIKDLTGIQDFRSLKTLICCENYLTSLDVSQNVFLTNLLCFSNQLTSLDVSKNIALIELICYENKLTSLDVSQNVSLAKLWCHSNLLITLDVSKNKTLKELVCHKNQLTVLDVSKNKFLEDLDCGFNQLKTLDLSRNKVLKDFTCYSNQLTFLDLRRNKYLEKFDCQGNQLTVLNVSKNLFLSDLNCSENPLSVLDVKKNTALIWLNCHSNQLDILDVSTNTALTWLSCRSNQLTTIDVSKNIALTEFYCFENRLKEVDVSENIALKIFKCNSNKITVLNTSQNKNLTILDCSNNKLTRLDFSKNTALRSLNCSLNELNTLNLANGNNIYIENIDATKNNNLKCIQVDEDNFPFSRCHKDVDMILKTSCQ